MKQATAYPLHIMDSNRIHFIPTFTQFLTIVLDRAACKNLSQQAINYPNQ